MAGVRRRARPMSATCGTPEESSSTLLHRRTPRQPNARWPICAWMRWVGLAIAWRHTCGVLFMPALGESLVQAGLRNCCRCRQAETAVPAQAGSTGATRAGPAPEHSSAARPTGGPRCRVGRLHRGCAARLGLRSRCRMGGCAASSACMPCATPSAMRTLSASARRGAALRAAAAFSACSIAHRRRRFRRWKFLSESTFVYGSRDPGAAEAPCTPRLTMRPAWGRLRGSPPQATAGHAPPPAGPGRACRPAGARRAATR